MSMRFLFKPEIQKYSVYGEDGVLTPTVMGQLLDFDKEAPIPVHALLLTKVHPYTKPMTRFEPLWIYKVRDPEVQDACEYYVLGVTPQYEVTIGELAEYYKKVQKFIHQNFIIVWQGDSKSAEEILQEMIEKEV